MKTIDERAREYADKESKNIFSNSTDEVYKKVLYEDYVKIATEQKEIDDSLLDTKVKLKVDKALATAFIENVKEKNELLENIYNWLYENATIKYMVDNQKLVGGDMIGEYYYDYEALVEDLKKYLGDENN